jgi:hypothetical protein
MIPRKRIGAVPLAVTAENAITAQSLVGYVIGNANGNIPVSNGTLNTNLNADMLDGMQASSFVQTGNLPAGYSGWKLKSSAGDVGASIKSNKPAIFAGSDGISVSRNLSTLTISPTYGSTDGTVAEGSTPFVINTSGNLSGGGTGTAGSGISLTLDTVADPTFSQVNFSSSSGSSLSFRAPAGVAANQIWVLPGADGTLNQSLVTDGAGNLSWASTGAAGFTSFTVAGDGGGGRVITDGNTLTIAGGANITTVDSAIDTVTVNLDGTLSGVTWNGNAIGVSYGGTGATDAAAARTNLGLIIGTDVQAQNASLAAIAAGTWTGASSINTLGTIGTGVWNGTDIDISDFTNLGVGGTMLQLVGDTLSLKEGTLTDGLLCAYVSGTGLVCNTSPGGVGVSYTAGSGLTLVGTEFKLGGTITENTNFNLFGASASRNIRFYNSNTAVEALYIQGADGNVGIGTTNPGQKLDVIGGSIRTDNQFISTLATGTSPFSIASTTLNTNLNADLLDGQHGTYYAPAANISGTQNLIAKFTSTTAVGDSRIFDNGTNIGIGNTNPETFLNIGNSIYMTALGGNVGIGTTNPANFKLQVTGDIGPSTTDTYSLGSDSYRWSNLWLGAETIHVGTAEADEGEISYITGNNVFQLQGNGNLALNPTSGNVGIGTTAPDTKLYVYESRTDTSGTFYTTENKLKLNNGSASTGSFTAGYNALFVYGNTVGSATAGRNYVYYGETANQNNLTGTYGMVNIENTAGTVSYAYGIIGDITKGSGGGAITDAYGVSGQINNQSSGDIWAGYALYASVVNGGAGAITNGYGLYIDSIAGTKNWGVYQSSSGNKNYFAGNVGIGTTNPDQALDVIGRIQMSTWTADGDTAVYRDDGTGNLGLVTSDRRLKKNITPVTGSLDIVNRLNAYKYNELDETDGTQKRLGVMAQEILPYMSELTYKFTREGSSTTYYGVHYDKLPVLLLGAMKEQQAEIMEQDTEISNVEFQISNQAQSVQELQTAVNEKLNLISNSISDLNTQYSTLNTKLSAAEQKLQTAENNLAAFQTSTNDTFSAMLETENMLTERILNHESRITELENKIAALTISGTGEIPSNVVTADANGNVSLAGVFEAKGIVAGEIAVKNEETGAAPVIGKAILEFGEKEIVIATTAVSENSQIFVTPKTTLRQPLAVTEIKSGESFKVEVEEAVSKDIEFSWWIVDEE